MTFNLLEVALVSQLFAILLIFCRVGAAMMLLPGFGESYVNPRARLLLAMAISFSLSPFLSQYLPPVPENTGILTLLLAGEIFMGIFMGMVARFLLAAMHVAGMVISFQSSLAMATQFDTTQASQGSIFGNFLSMSALVLIFATDMHHVMLNGVVDSYSMVLPGTMPPVEDIANYMGQLVSLLFKVGVQLAAPSLAVGLLLYMSAGILARLMPNMQVFFVLMPLQLLLSMFMLMAVFTVIMTEFMQYFSATFSDFMETL